MTGMSYYGYYTANKAAWWSDTYASQINYARWYQAHPQYTAFFTKSFNFSLTQKLIFGCGYSNGGGGDCYNNGTYSSWTMTVSGVTGTGDCASINGSFTLTGTGFLCRWPSTATYPSSQPIWQLSFLSGSGGWILDAYDHTGTLMAQYQTTSSGADWNCTTANIINLEFHFSCSGWPATITLTPVTTQPEFFPPNDDTYRSNANTLGESSSCDPSTGYDFLCKGNYVHPTLTVNDINGSSIPCGLLYYAGDPTSFDPNMNTITRYWLEVISTIDLGTHFGLVDGSYNTVDIYTSTCSVACDPCAAVWQITVPTFSGSPSNCCGATYPDGYAGTFNMCSAGGINDGFSGNTGSCQWTFTGTNPCTGITNCSICPNGMSPSFTFTISGGNNCNVGNVNGTYTLVQDTALANCYFASTETTSNCAGPIWYLFVSGFEGFGTELINCDNTVQYNATNGFDCWNGGTLTLAIDNCGNFPATVTITATNMSDPVWTLFYDSSSSNWILSTCNYTRQCSACSGPAAGVFYFTVSGITGTGCEIYNGSFELQGGYSCSWYQSLADGSTWQLYHIGTWTLALFDSSNNFVVYYTISSFNCNGNNTASSPTVTSCSGWPATISLTVCSAPQWTLPASSFNCLGQNTLNIGTSSGCSWPSTLTVTPVFPNNNFYNNISCMNTGCQQLPNTLYVTFGTVSSCPCLSGQSFVLTYNYPPIGSGAWGASGPTCSGQSSNLLVGLFPCSGEVCTPTDGACSSMSWDLNVYCGSFGAGAFYSAQSITTCTYSPFCIQFTGLNLFFGDPSNCCPSAATDSNVVITVSSTLGGSCGMGLMAQPKKSKGCGCNKRNIVPPVKRNVSPPKNVPPRKNYHERNI